MVIIKEIIRPKSFGPAIYQTIICMRDANIDCLLEKHNSETLVRERVLPVRFCGSEGLITEPIFINDVLSCGGRLCTSMDAPEIRLCQLPVRPLAFRGWGSAYAWGNGCRGWVRVFCEARDAGIGNWILGALLKCALPDSPSVRRRFCGWWLDSEFSIFSPWSIIIATN